MPEGLQRCQRAGSRCGWELGLLHCEDTIWKEGFPKEDIHNYSK